jgi:hypothetical protein
MGCGVGVLSREGVAGSSSPTYGLLQPGNFATVVQATVKSLKNVLVAPDIEVHWGHSLDIFALELLPRRLGIDQLSVSIKLQ